IDATRKWDYPPVSLPKKEYMERAKQLWERLELPKLNPQDPWFGYNLGLWSSEDEEEADLALKGEHYQIGERRAQQRVAAKKKKKRVSLAQNHKKRPRGRLKTDGGLKKPSQSGDSNDASL